MVELIGTAKALYFVVDLLCAGIIASLEITTLGRGFSKRDNRIMYWMLLTQSAVFTLDGIWVLVDGSEKLPIAINYMVNSCYFGTSAICAYTWLVFVDHQIDGKFMKNNRRRILFAWPIFIVAVLAFSAPIDGWLYTIGEGNIYVRGPLYILQPIIVYSYMIFGVLDVFASSSSFKLKKARTVERSIVILSFIPLTGGVFQIYNGGLPVLNATMTICIVYIYTIIQTERTNYQSAIIDSLSDDYKVVGLVDISNLMFSFYRGQKYYEYIASKAPINKNTSVIDFINFAAKYFVYEDDRERFLEEVSIGRIEYELSKHGDFYVAFRALYKGEYAYFLLKFAKPISKALPADMFLFGIKNTDVSTKKELIAKEELERARKSAEYANKSKSTFLFNMSHDIRTPMNAIIGFTDMAEKYIDDKERVADSLDKVKTSSRHLLNLINDILDMARIENGKIDIAATPVDINESLERLKFIIGDMAKDKNITLKIKNNGLEHPYVYSDELHTNQILLNIISNAVKYTNNGGNVTVTVNERPSIDKEKARIEYIVSDTGMGMTPEFLEHIFDAFERDNTTAVEGIQGTGLGMSITKRLVDLMGGTIEVESIYGQGSTFTVVLEYEIYEGDFEEERKLKEEKKAVQKEISLEGKLILLVDDNELNREIAVDILTDAGAKVDTAEDGVIAVDMVKNADTLYDLVLMDVQMPRMNGYDATRAIRNLDDLDRASLPIIAMTGNAFEEDKRNAKEAGMNAHLTKPVDIAKLMETLSEFI